MYVAPPPPLSGPRGVGLAPAGGRRPFLLPNFALRVPLTNAKELVLYAGS